VALDANSVPLGGVTVEANRVDPRPGDNVRSPLCDLVVCGASLVTPEHTNPGNAIPAPRSSGTGDLGITKLLLPGPPGSSSPSIDWR
jgi:hypothetical protein